MRVNADKIAAWYKKYQAQENTLVIYVPPVMDKMEKLGHRVVKTPEKGVFGKDKIVVEYVYEDLLEEDSEIPQTAPEGQTNGSGSLAVKTGDHGNVMIWCGIGMTSIILIGMTMVQRRKRK